jgi:hypothetical protein
MKNSISTQTMQFKQKNVEEEKLETTRTEKFDFAA